MDKVWDISEVLRDPSLLDRVSIPQAEAWVKQYPGYDLAHVLLLKKYRQTNDADYEQYLPVAALYVTDRAQLKSLMEDESSWEQPIVLPHHDETVTDTYSQQVVETEPSPEPTAIEADAEANRDEEQGIEETVVSEPVAESQSNLSERHSFLGWLQQLQAAPQEEAEASPKAVDSTSQHEPRHAESILDATAYMEALWQKEFAGSDVPDLAGMGKRSIAQNELDEAEQRARRSVEMGDELVTETLARIYVQQGNHDRAIDTYTKLILKYPEKSDYFAAKIAELQQKRP